MYLHFVPFCFPPHLTLGQLQQTAQQLCLLAQCPHPVPPGSTFRERMWYFTRSCHQTNHGSVGSTQIVTCLPPFSFPQASTKASLQVIFLLTYKQNHVAFASVFQPYGPLRFLRLFAAAFQPPHNLPLRASPRPFPSISRADPKPIEVNRRPSIAFQGPWISSTVPL